MEKSKIGVRIGLHVGTVLASVVATYACIFCFGFEALQVITRRLVITNSDDNVILIVDDGKLQILRPMVITRGTNESAIFSIENRSDGSIRLSPLDQHGNKTFSVNFLDSAEIRVVDETEKIVWQSP